MSVHVPRLVVKSECRFLYLTSVQSCHFGIVHETVNVIDLVICKATPNNHVVGKLVRIDSYTSFHIISICSVLCRKEILQRSSQTARDGFVLAIRAESLVRSIFLVYLSCVFSCLSFPGNTLICLIFSGFARSRHVHFLDGRSARDFTHQADEPTVFQSVASRHLWILLPTLRLHICSRQDFQRADHGNWCTTENIFSSFGSLDVKRSQHAPLPMWHDRCSWAQLYNTWCKR